MLCFSGFELYSRWVPLFVNILVSRREITSLSVNPQGKSPFLKPKRNSVAVFFLSCRRRRRYVVA